MAVADAATIEDRPAWGRGALAKNEDVSPSREDQNRRSTDASGIAFPLPLVLIIIAIVVPTIGSVWAFTAGIKTDLRVVLQRLDDQGEAQKLKDELWQRQQDIMQKQLDANERKLELLRLEYQQFHDQQIRKVP